MNALRTAEAASVGHSLMRAPWNSLRRSFSRTALDASPYLAASPLCCVNAKQTRKRLKPPPPGHHSRRSQPNSRSRTEGLSVPSRSTSTLSGYARCFQTALCAPDAAGDSASSCACTRPGRGEEADRRGVGSSGKGGSCSGRLRALQRSPTGRCAARGEAGRVLRAQGGSGGPGGAA